MNGGHRGAPTRANLLRARRRKERVGKGIELLRRKREALVRELLRLATATVEDRSRVQERARSAYPRLLDALSERGGEALRAMGWPRRDLRVRLRTIRIWGVPAPRIEETGPVVRTMEARSTAPSLTGPAASTAATTFEELVQALLEVAPRELLLRRMGGALARTSRQLHALERRVEPRLEKRIRSIRRTLDEREREDRYRLKRHLRRSRSGLRRPGGGTDDAEKEA